MGAHQQRGALLFEQRRYDLAIEQFREELALDPESAPANAMLALCQVELERLEPATEHARAAIARAPDWAFAHYAMARVCSERNHDAQALAAIDEALRLDPEDADYHGFRAGLLLDAGSWSEALTAAERGLALDSEHVGCQNLRAMALGRLGRKRLRGEALDSALAIDPGNPVTHANRGWMLLEAGQVDAALESFGEALRLDPQNRWAREGIVSALKAQNPVYRGLLAYFFWMTRLSPRARWGVVLGAYFGHRLLSNLAERVPGWAPWILPISLLYLVFVFLTWTAEPLFNLLLFLNRHGRRVLDREERVAAMLQGAILSMALLSVPLLRPTTLDGWLSTFAILAVSIPSAAASAAAGWPRWVLGAVAALLGALALFGLSTGLWAAGADGERLRAGIFGAVLLGSVLSTWLASALQSVKVRR